MTVIIETSLSHASAEELVDELERRGIVDERLLRACGPNTIAAELVWRASKPRDVGAVAISSAWRPGRLTRGEALVLARHACDNALCEAADQGQQVAADVHGVAYLTGAALLVLEKLEPGRWHVRVEACGYRPEVSVSERDG